MSDNGTIDMAAFADIIGRLGNGKGTALDGVDEDIKYHDTPEEKSIVVPQGMSMETVEDLARRKAAELNKIHSFTHISNMRPEDGAHAAAIVIKRMFGLTIGKATRTMFGEEPPEYRTIDVAYGVQKEVPWGKLEVPALPGAVFQFGAADSEMGPVFGVQVQSPKKHKSQIESFFKALDDELKVNSIYRGHPLMGAHTLKFMDVSKFRSDEIVFADSVQRTIDAAIFGLLDHTDATKAAGLPTKRAVLAYGPYGTGKSSLGLITAQRAQAANWTYLAAKAGSDNLRDVLKTAKLYQPAVVFIEDIDVHTPKASDKDAVSELLDLFDGITSKNDEVLIVMTTNHIEKVPAGMLRPGRLDHIVEINGLDRGGVERLISRVIRADLLAPDVDFDAVFEPMAEWQPAWVRAVADRAQQYALAREEGQLTYSITTDDLVSTAISMLPQLKLMEDALEGYHEPELHEALGREIEKHTKAAVGQGLGMGYIGNSEPSFELMPLTGRVKS